MYDIRTIFKTHDVISRIQNTESVNANGRVRANEPVVSLAILFWLARKEKPCIYFIAQSLLKLSPIIVGH